LAVEERGKNNESKSFPQKEGFLWRVGLKKKEEQRQTKMEQGQKRGNKIGLKSGNQFF